MYKTLYVNFLATLTTYIKKNFKIKGSFQLTAEKSHP